MLLYHIFTGFSWVSLTVTIQNLPSFSPLIIFISFLDLLHLHYPTPPHPFPSCSALVPSYILYPEALRCRRSFCLLNLPAVVDHKLNTEHKCVGDVHAHAWPLLCLGFAAPSSLSSSCLLTAPPPPPPPLSCYQWCYSGTTGGGWGGRETVLSSSHYLFFNSFTVLLSIIHPLLLLLITKSSILNPSQTQESGEAG